MTNVANFFKFLCAYKYINKRFVVFSGLLFPFVFLYPQTVLTGTVTEEGTNDPVAGATIIEKGTTNGITSDIDGNFRLTLTQSFPVTIIVQFLGYTTQEIEVTSDRIDILLSETANALNEIVVVGYGVQRRKELTGAISTVSPAILRANTSPSIDGLLAGTVAGLNVTQASGQPGASSSVRIRGGNSVNANNDPLYVIDGFIYYRDASTTKTGLGGIESSVNPLASINPSDIESIEVLKDVSATAIYGSRGANGVIIVTTKKGKRGGTFVSYRTTVGWSSAAKKLDLLNASEWAQFQKDYFNNKGNYTDEEIAALGEGYNWQDAVLRTGVSQIHELSVSGGDEKTRYLISGNYTDQDGIILNSDFKRYNARINFDRDLYSNVQIGVSSTFGKTVQNSLTTTEPVNYNSSPFSAGITNSLTYALFMPPVVPIYNSDGSYNYTNPYEYAYFAIGNKSVNPVSDLENSVGETINNYVLGNIYTRITIADGLVAKASLGADISTITQNYFAPSYTALGLAEQGVGGIGTKRYESLQSELTLAYTKQLNDAHYIDLLGGYTYQSTNINYVKTIVSHFTNESLKHNNLADGAVTYTPESGTSDATLHSVIARANYTLLQKYNLTATFRADNSSRFAANHRWGYFPSIGLSWNINEEEFLNSKRNLSNLKLRVSAGTVGNQEIGDYEYAQSYQAGQYNGSASYSKNNNGNNNLKWETTTQYNVGLDAGFFNTKLNFVLDLYSKKTSDLLLSVPVSSTTGVTSQLENIGNVTNKGIEFSINAILIDNGNVFWSLNGNIAHNKNKITSMGSTERLLQGTNSEQILQVGYALGSFYGLVFDGIVQTGEDITELPATSSGLIPGSIKFVDISGPDGVPDGKIDQYDRTVLGDIQPDFTYGISSSFRYRKFDLFVLFQGSKGNKIYNSLRRALEHATDSYNVSRALLNSWTPDNPSDTYPAITGSRPYSFIDSRYVEDGSYLKLKNLTLGYTVSLQKYPVNLRLFATAQNLFTITNYQGYDPEVATGMDIGAYPTARTFSLGLELSF
ncbi:MAG: TonB-dependent receptor [Candidatus Azobacteroides sp.]|nr:TonB-dependent receptor [Candidatus Azobacteroides sp.]